MSIADSIADAHSALAALMGGGTAATITIDGETYDALPTELRMSEQLALGGFNPLTDRLVSVRKEQLATAPAYGTRCTFDSREFKVNSTTDRLATWLLELKSSKR